MGLGTVLICGAGIAGPTLAYWLAREGFRPTVVERARGLRSSGNPVDVRRGAAHVAGRMGIMPRLRDAATHATGFSFVTASGRRIGPLRLGRPHRGEVEVPRADLSAILCDAARDDAEFLFGDAITALRQDTGGVDVTFEHAAPRRFDLVVGADGLHSSVRTLVFGPETDFVRHLGLYVATLPLDRLAADPATILMYNAPGRSLTVHPVRGSEGAAFIFRGPARPGLDRRDVEAHKRITLDAYAGWPAPAPPVLPELLERLRAADDLYFDSVSRVRLPAWSRGRVALLGDAASCMSLFGDGSSLAMIGATTLAETLAVTPEDHAAAFRAYETRHRKASGPSQRGHTLASALLVPATHTGITVRNLTACLLPRVPTPPPRSAGSK
ncbi:FAD-dependent urate hydroxylase [Arthrobacter sp. Bi26]|uniref:FAD-dependent monooxygenase n=1 Tax=Arthrobacter sp. Bi26 TaxID=2822350 RepID=UPI001D6BD333|nr:FAD-dependent monooxygenase [Arthrobacter sp. Bi26]CAH0229608.1 FAD-dependent urate hydroxylase [Arthrobacter sp. Bi26]